MREIVGSKDINILVRFRKNSLFYYFFQLPDFIFISAGFDGYKNDPLGGLGLEVADFQTLTSPVKKLAAECCGGRIVSVLEGGYSLDGLPLCIEAHLKGLE